MNFLHRVHRAEVNDEANQRLETTRTAYHECFAEAQMMASPAVLRELDSLSDQLSEGYRKTRRLHDGHTEDSFDEIREELIHFWDQWRMTRAEMRRDLGVEDAGSPAVP